MTRWHEKEIYNNQIFGKWKVIDKKNKKIKRGKCWKYLIKCECECGTIRFVDKYTLQDGRSQSCRTCFSKIPINIGDKIDKWTIKSFLEKIGSLRYFEVQCLCGTLRKRADNIIRSRRITQCLKCQLISLHYKLRKKSL